MAITKATASSIAPAAKGDLVAGSATNDAAVLTVGANDTVLTADSSTATGLKWATPAAGGMTLLSTTTLSGTSTTISSINQNYTNLQIFVESLSGTGGYLATLRINGDSSGRYNNLFTVSNATWTFSADETYARYTVNPTLNKLNFVSITIPNYASSSVGKIIQSFSTSNISSTPGVVFTTTTFGAISSLTFSSGQGTESLTGTVLIYGVK
jgi:hypothetical protein